MSVFRLMIVDDHPIVLTGLKLLFHRHPRFVVVGEASSARVACAEAERLQPDAIISDLIMGPGDGLKLIGSLRAILPETRLVIYSSCDEAIWAPLAIRAGAEAYVAKSVSLEAVGAALDRVMSGVAQANDAVIHSANGLWGAVDGLGTPVDGLSVRELQVLQLMGGGGTLQSLAAQLQLSVKTVGTYRERLKIKLGFDSVRILERFAADYVAGRLQ